MGAAVETRSRDIDVVMPYVVAGEAARFYPTNREASYWPVEEHAVRVHDARPELGRFELERNGFVVVRHQTAVKDFYDPDEIKRVYYPEIEALVKRLNGASKVIMYGEMARSDAPGTGDGKLPARGAHVDYTEDQVRWQVRNQLDEAEAERRLQGRFVHMNLWRPIRPVERTPLALCDASTVSREDLNPSTIYGGLDDPNRPPMHGYNLQYNPRHRWYWMPRMQPDEVYVFKLCDSDRSRIQHTGHTAIDDPTAPADAKPRESIEIRTVSFFDN